MSVALLTLVGLALPQAASANGVATHAFQSPTTGVQFTEIFTIFLDATRGSGGIDSVINGTGGSSTAANADVPVDVLS